MRIVEVTDRKSLIDFIRVPWRIFKGDDNWVPPIVADMLTTLNKRKNPFFNHADAAFFIAYDDSERPIGRIAAVYDRLHFKYRGENVGYFGYFDAIEDVDVAKALLEKAEEWVRGRGAVFIRGPIDLSMNNTCGLLIEGFDDPPVFMMPYNKPYYQFLIEENGYVKAKDLLAYWVDLYYDEKPKQLVRYVEKLVSKIKNIRARYANLRKFREELDRFKEVYNDAWMDNWGFVPLTDEEIEFMAKRMKPLVVSKLAVFAETLGGEPVGVALAMPDYNFVFKRMKGSLFPFGIIKFFLYRNQIPRIRLMVLGVKKAYRLKGIEFLMLGKMYEYAMKKGYTGAEFSWILEDNEPIKAIIERFGGKVYKKYRIYEKKIR
ncbi:conserved hypothetical protein [Thermosulfidibacter takaii ABI70S6]|uniref:N-acetyltransferase domain-containing protein n=1 Tax=Thermosulfidibacter takaii (strain DSM 17441 / JCM 13301 / NBRC 103674 / ABI70S6) TaxID=1298851 RepID=A0A0S3QUP4_THET7|nr:hypothetical protein [Thermosulfidibacter takaii]BAT72052.1 conserved hypothetical protein [Thermosulfidibacter takaii ABI70S6]